MTLSPRTPPDVSASPRREEQPQTDVISRIAERFDASHDFTFERSCVMLCYVGSSSHGTSIPSTDPNGIDDVDLMAVVIPPARYLLGLESFEHWVAQWDELDVVVYDYRKFVRLLAKGNPNVLGTLWLREQDYVLRRTAWMQLVDNRPLFATRAAHGSFAGYANGQLERMTSYSQAIQAEIDQLTADLAAAGWHLQDVMDCRPLPMPKGLVPDAANKKAQRLRHLRAKYHSAYMGEKRRRLVVEHGYDTKNAAHLVRLLRMCVEFMRTGEMSVYRGDIDAEELKQIKRGEWSLGTVKEHAKGLFEIAKEARDASPLPLAPDMAAISNVVTWSLFDRVLAECAP